MLVRGKPNPPTLTTIAVVVGIGLTLIILGAVSLGIAIIGVFATVSLLELLWTRYHR